MTHNKKKQDNQENIEINSKENTPTLGRKMTKSFDYIPLDPYNGKPEHFDKYFENYRNLAVACNWTEGEMIQRLPLYLKGYMLRTLILFLIFDHLYFFSTV